MKLLSVGLKLFVLIVIDFVDLSRVPKILCRLNFCQHPLIQLPHFYHYKIFPCLNFVFSINYAS